MSTSYVNFIPKDRMKDFDDERSEAATQRLEQMVDAWSIWYTRSELPEPHALPAIGSVWCPHCKAEVDDNVFFHMLEQNCQESHFVHLDVVMPCCGRPSALDQLDYCGQIGFARFCIDIEQPNRMDRDWQPVLEFVENWFGCPFLQLNYRI